MNDVAAIIRLCYLPDSDETNRAWRFRFFRDHVLPRLIAQTVPTDVWVWVHPRHLEEARSIAGVRPFTVDLEAPSREFEETTLRGYPWSAVNGMPRYRFQVLLGSDDLISPVFIERSLAALRGIHGRRALVTHHPLMLDWATQRIYAMRQWPRRPSPFVVLRQPAHRNYPYAFIWDLPHTHLKLLTPGAWKYLPSGDAVMVVHDYNDLTRLDPTLREIERPRWL